MEMERIQDGSLKNAQLQVEILKHIEEDRYQLTKHADEAILIFWSTISRLAFLCIPVLDMSVYSYTEWVCIHATHVIF